LVFVVELQRINQSNENSHPGNDRLAEQSQKAVDDAKSAIPHSKVDVYNYVEVNRVLDAASGNTNINQRVINKVVPFVTNLDCVSYSSYDVMDASASKLWSTLDYMQSMLPTNKATVVSGGRIWIGEYGWGTQTNVAPGAEQPRLPSAIAELENGAALHPFLGNIQ
jgi:hypothetical protein